MAGSLEAAGKAAGAAADTAKGAMKTAQQAKAEALNAARAAKDKAKAAAEAAKDQATNFLNGLTKPVAEIKDKAASILDNLPKFDDLGLGSFACQMAVSTLKGAINTANAVCAVPKGVLDAANSMVTKASSVTSQMVTDAVGAVITVAAMAGREVLDLTTGAIHAAGGPSSAEFRDYMKSAQSLAAKMYNVSQCPLFAGPEFADFREACQNINAILNGSDALARAFINSLNTQAQTALNSLIAPLKSEIFGKLSAMESMYNNLMDSCGIKTAVTTAQNALKCIEALCTDGSNPEANAFLSSDPIARLGNSTGLFTLGPDGNPKYRSVDSLPADTQKARKATDDTRIFRESATATMILLANGYLDAGNTFVRERSSLVMTVKACDVSKLLPHLGDYILLGAGGSARLFTAGSILCQNTFPAGGYTAVSFEVTYQQPDICPEFFKNEANTKRVDLVDKSSEYAAVLASTDASQIGSGEQQITFYTQG